MSARTSRRKDQARRAKLRAKLTAEGTNEQLIEAIIQRERYTALVKRHGPKQARKILAAQAPRGPSDTGFKPRPPDPLLNGAARVSGIAAKVVRRENTITEYQHDAMCRTNPGKA